MRNPKSGLRFENEQMCIVCIEFDWINERFFYGKDRWLTCEKQIISIKIRCCAESFQPDSCYEKKIPTAKIGIPPAFSTKYYFFSALYCDFLALYYNFLTQYYVCRQLTREINAIWLSAWWPDNPLPPPAAARLYRVTSQIIIC